jgi:hypothetical protein
MAERLQRAEAERGRADAAARQRKPDRVEDRPAGGFRAMLELLDLRSLKLFPSFVDRGVFELENFCKSHATTCSHGLPPKPTRLNLSCTKKISQFYIGSQRNAG